MAKKPKYNKISLTLIITVLTIIGGIIGAVEFIVIEPLKTKNVDLKMEIENLKTGIEELNRTNDTARDEIQQLSFDVEKLQESYNTVTKDVERPLLLTPVDGSSIIGDQVKFEWKHESWSEDQEYILEIRKIDKSFTGESNDDNFQRFKISDLDPKQKMMFFPISKVFSSGTQTDKSFSGEYLWRIKPGSLVIHDEKEFEVLQGEASHFNSFKIYHSVIERIERTGKLLVGTSPTLLSGYFSVYDINGTVDGFDIDLIEWIADELESEQELKFGTGLKVEIIDVPFKDLLHKLRNDEFDLVISSLTSTEKRETEGLKFTNGYFKTHQIFITSKSRKYKEGESEEEEKTKLNKALKENGIKVGARAGSTNLKAAQYLSYKYGFEICRYQSYPDIYKALKDQAINFGLVDDVLVAEELGREKGDLEKIGPMLDSYLEGFYISEYGRKPKEADMYAIAVMDNNLRNAVNSILEKGGTQGIQKWTEGIQKEQEGEIKDLRARFEEEIVKNVEP